MLRRCVIENGQCDRKLLSLVTVIVRLSLIPSTNFEGNENFFSSADSHLPDTDISEKTRAADARTTQVIENTPHDCLNAKEADSSKCGLAVEDNSDAIQTDQETAQIVAQQNSKSLYPKAGLYDLNGVIDLTGLTADDLADLVEQELAKHIKRLARRVGPAEESKLRNSMRHQLELKVKDQMEKKLKAENKSKSKEQFLNRAQLLFHKVWGDFQPKLTCTQLENPRKLLSRELKSFKQIDEAQNLDLLPHYDLPTLRHMMIARTDTKTTERRLAEFRRHVASLLKKDETAVTSWELTMMARWMWAAEDFARNAVLGTDDDFAKRMETIERYSSFKEYFLRARDEASALYRPDGRINRKWLHPKWGVIHLKGVGEIAVPESYVAQAQSIQDQWVSHKFQLLHPVEKRGEGFEFIGNERAMTTLNRFIGIFERILKRAIEARKPSEDDFDYPMPTQAEKAFSGLSMDCSLGNSQFFQNDITPMTARIYNNVFPKYRLRPVCQRQQVLWWVSREGAARGWGAFNPDDAGRLLDQSVYADDPQITEHT